MSLITNESKYLFICLWQFEYPLWNVCTGIFSSFPFVVLSLWICRDSLYILNPRNKYKYTYILYILKIYSPTLWLDFLNVCDPLS